MRVESIPARVVTGVCEACVSGAQHRLVGFLGCLGTRDTMADLGEQILDDADLFLNSFPKEFAFIRQMHHRDRSFTLEQMKQTAINFHIDELSRKSSVPTVAGRGAAMAAASRSEQCHQCKAFGHYQRDCPGVAKTNGSKRKPKKGKKGRTGDPSPKWCSCLLYTSPSPRDLSTSRMPSSA